MLFEILVDERAVLFEDFDGDVPVRRGRRDAERRLHVLDNLERAAAYRLSLASYLRGRGRLRRGLRL
jgi:hypothetical protein